jgi:hypothetical protein
MSYPSFSVGEVLTAADMNAVGLWKITEATATSGNSLNIDNIFSSNYRSYRLVIDDVRIVSGVTGISAQLRVSGSTNNTTYYNVRQGFDYTTGVAGAAPTANGSVWNLPLIVDGGNSAGCVLDIFNPFLTQKTGYAGQGVDTRTTGYGALSGSGFHNTAASYTGISINHGNTYTNIKVVVYGYRI